MSNFIILRRETAGGFSTRGPVVRPMSFKDARDEIVRLKKVFPHQDFVIMGEVGEVTRSERVTVKVDAPDLSDAKKKRRPRKSPSSNGSNVVPLRTEKAG